MQNLVDDTRRMAYGSMAEQINLLATDYPLEGDRLIFELDVQGITPGMVLSSGLNVWYVKEVTPAAKTVYVIPRYDGSYSNSLPAGTVVFVKPRATDWMLFNEVNNVIVQMSSRTHGLYRVGSWMGVQNPTWQEYPIPADVAPLLTSQPRVYVREYGAGWDRWVEVNALSVKWQPGLDVVRLTSELGWNREVRFEYTAPFKKGENLAWDVELMSGLAPTMTDIPALGAAAALLRTTESRRNQISPQGDPRRAGEVAAGANTGSARLMQQQYQDRINDEYVRLLNRNPLTLGI
jgi:hypothetical protein